MDARFKLDQWRKIGGADGSRASLTVPRNHLDAGNKESKEIRPGQTKTKLPEAKFRANPL